MLHLHLDFYFNIDKFFNIKQLVFTFGILLVAMIGVSMAAKEDVEMRKKVLKEMAAGGTKDPIKIKGYYGGYYPYSPYYPLMYGRPYYPYSPYYGRWGGYWDEEMDSILDDLIDEISVSQPTTTATAAGMRKKQVLEMAQQQTVDDPTVDVTQCQNNRCACLAACDLKTDLTQRILCRVNCILSDCRM